MSYVKTLTQQKLSFFLALYLGFILNIPVFYRRFSPLLDSPNTKGVISALIEVAIVILFTFFFLRLLSLGGKIFFRIVATLFTIICVASAWYMAVFNVVIGYGIVASVLTTDIDLSKEVIGWQFSVSMILLNVLPLFLIWRSHLQWTLIEQLRTPGERLKACFCMVLTVILVWAPLRYLDKEHKRQDKRNNIDMPSYGGVIAHSYLPSNWLSALGLFTWTHIEESLNASERFDPATAFTWNEPEGMKDTYVVFVIGETTRWDHMGLLGYERDTTPKMSQEKNLVAFRGESCDTATKLSLRCMFVREGGAMDNPGRTVKEQNLFSVMKKLGFSSELFAMQSEIWFYDNTNTDNFLFREQIGSEKDNQGKAVDDMLLLPKLNTSVQRHPQGKHLVILHTKGSHYLYSQRYSRDFARYQPECMGVDEFCSKEQLVNSFDNSVLYTDAFLSKIFDQLRDKKAIVFYAADHGESIDDDTHLHGTPRELAPPEQFRVPLIVWASDKYLDNPVNKQAFERLQQQQREGKTHRHVELFDSVLGCLGYSSPDGGIKAKNNWCQAPDQPAKSE